MNKHLLFFAVIFFSYFHLSAQPGTLDLTFDIGTGFNDRAEAIAIQSDGKILVGGDFTSFNGTSVNRICRLNSDGSIDNSFNPGTGISSGGVSGIFIKSDKILVTGCFETFNGASYNKIVRLNSDGSIDNSFDPGTGFDGCVYNVAMQADGKMIVMGQVTTYDGNTIGNIVRINDNGSIDNTFNTGIGFDAYPYSIAIQTDGKLIAGGTFTTFMGAACDNIIRLNTNGSLDNTFTTTGTGFDGAVYSVVLRTDGKFLVGGGFTYYNTTAQSRIALLNSDGSLDNSFIPDGTGFNNYIWKTAIQQDDKIVVIGNYSQLDGATQGRIATLNTDGSLNTLFATGTGFDMTTRALALQTDGKILVGGWFTDYNGTPRNRIVRLNADLSIGIETQKQNSVALWADGNNIIADATKLNASSQLSICNLLGQEIISTTLEPNTKKTLTLNSIENIVVVKIISQNYHSTQKLFIHQ